MTYSATPPGPPEPPEQEFKVTFRHGFESHADAGQFEKRIAEAVARELGVPVTVDWDLPF